MANPWIIQDGPYWRRRSETLRRMADETETFGSETRARMLRIAKDYDVLAERAEQSLRRDKSVDYEASPSIRRLRASPSVTRRRGRPIRQAAGA